MEHDWLTRVPGHVVCRPDQFGLTDVELRVGSGHHQFVITHAGQSWVETVGVFEDGAAELPILRDISHPCPFASRVEVGCTVTEHSARGLRKELARIRTTLESAPLAVCVQDPEEPAAITAATCHVDRESHALLWWTWRVLPEHGAVLRTAPAGGAHGRGGPRARRAPVARPAVRGAARAARGRRRRGRGRRAAVRHGPGRRGLSPARPSCLRTATARCAARARPAAHA